MNLTLIQIKALVAALALVGFAVLGVWYHHHVFEEGVAQESARRDKIDAINKAKAENELAKSNERVDQAQKQLDYSREQLSGAFKDLENEKSKSAAYQSDLAAERVRYTVLVKQHNASQTKDTASPGTGSLDQVSYVEADLSGSAAVSIERLRLNENSAVMRLNACIASYDAVKKAADSLMVPSE